MKLNLVAILIIATVLILVVPTVEHALTGGFGWPTYISVGAVALYIIVRVGAGIINWLEEINA